MALRRGYRRQRRGKGKFWDALTYAYEKVRRPSLLVKATKNFYKEEAPQPVKDFVDAASHAASSVSADKLYSAADNFVNDNYYDVDRSMPMTSAEAMRATKRVPGRIKENVQNAIPSLNPFAEFDRRQGEKIRNYFANRRERHLKEYIKRLGEHQAKVHADALKYPTYQQWYAQYTDPIHSVISQNKAKRKAYQMSRSDIEKIYQKIPEGHMQAHLAKMAERAALQPEYDALRRKMFKFRALHPYEKMLRNPEKTAQRIQWASQ